MPIDSCRLPINPFFQLKHSAFFSLSEVPVVNTARECGKLPFSSPNAGRPASSGVGHDSPNLISAVTSAFFGACLSLPIQIDLTGRSRCSRSLCAHRRLMSTDGLQILHSRDSLIAVLGERLKLKHIHNSIVNLAT